MRRMTSFGVIVSPPVLTDKLFHRKSINLSG
nr:MAG TPA: hypothetical protein [Caudoviricetes sp.]